MSADADSRGKKDNRPASPGSEGVPLEIEFPGTGLGEVKGRIESTDSGGGEILVGTSGYSFDDWVGKFYPDGIRKGNMLSYYVQHFPVVEVNSSYYRIPRSAVLHQMERKTPPGFEFIIKAHKSMTHSLDAGPDEYSQFIDALEPVQDAGKFSGVLLQFPWGFKHTRGARDHLKSLRANLPEFPLFVEFRNDGWIRDETFSLLEDLGIGYCSVDEPRLKGLVPPIVKNTGGAGYVRLHGRNAKNWWGRTAGGDRYDYMYSNDELKEWVDKIRGLAAEAKKTYVFFNNCHAGQAATNAQLMQQMLRG
jgi:uncharacterized protein YecE (DUF72 family)